MFTTDDGHSFARSVDIVHKSSEEYPQLEGILCCPNPYPGIHPHSVRLADSNREDQPASSLTRVYFPQDEAWLGDISSFCTVSARNSKSHISPASPLILLSSLRSGSSIYFNEARKIPRSSDSSPTWTLILPREQRKPLIEAKHFSLFPSPSFGRLCVHRGRLHRRVDDRDSGSAADRLRIKMLCRCKFTSALFCFAKVLAALSNTVCIFTDDGRPCHAGEEPVAYAIGDMCARVCVCMHERMC